MQFIVAIGILCVSVLGAPIPGGEDDEFLGLAWEAAASSVNTGTEERFIVPIEVISATKSGSISTLEVVFQESWCSPAEGNDLEDICESMCPVYYGGNKSTYRIVATESNGGNDFISQKID